MADIEMEKTKKEKVTQKEKQVDDERIFNDYGDGAKPSVLHGLYEYSSASDVTLMITGSVFAVIAGLMVPVLSIFFGGMTNIYLASVKYANDPHYAFAYYGKSIKLHHVAANVTQSTSLPPDFINEAEFLALTSKYSLFYLIIGLVAFGSSFLQVYCWETATDNILNRIRKSYYSQLLRQNAQWFDENVEGNLVNKLTDDVEKIRLGLGSKVPLLIQFISIFISGSAVGFCRSWKLTGLLFAGCPFIFIASGYTAKAFGEVALREQVRYGIAGEIAAEVLGCIKTIASFGGEEKELERYYDALDKGQKLNKTKYLKIGISVSLSISFMFVLYSIGVYYGAKLFTVHQLKPGDIFTVFTCILSGAFTFTHSIPVIADVAQAFGVGKSVFNVISRIPSIDPYSTDGVVLQKVHGYISFENVSFSYSTRPDMQVLNGLNLEIPAGDCVALVGSSGGGKSTVVSLLMRFYDPVGGKITLDGVPLTDFRLDWLRSQIGLVSQEPVLFGASILENIRYGQPDATFADIIKAAKLANAHSFISSLPQGYDTEVGDRGVLLSGGQKQRIAIARGLVRDPKILLLDEATSALDVESESVVQAALDNAMKGRTTVVIAHRLSTIRNASKICVLKEGKLVEEGTHDQLLAAQSHYYHLAVLQRQAEEADEETDQFLEHINEMPMRSVSSRRLSRKSTRKRLSTRSTTVRSLFQNDPTDNEINENEKNGNPFLFLNIFKINLFPWGLTITSVVFSLLVGFVQPFFTVIYSEVVQLFTLQANEFTRAVNAICGSLGVIAIYALISYFLALYLGSLATEVVIQMLRYETFKKFIHQQSCWFDEADNSPLALTSMLSSDPPKVKSIFGTKFGFLLSSVVTIITSVAITYYSSWKLAAIVTMIFPIMILISVKYNQVKRSPQAEEYKRFQEAFKLAADSMQNIKTVQALGLQPLFIHSYCEFLDQGLNATKWDSLLFGCVYGGTQAMMFLAFSATFKFGAEFLDAGYLDLADIYRTMFAIATSATAVTSLSTFTLDLSEGMEAMSSFLSRLNTSTEFHSVSTEGSRPAIKGKIEFRDVIFRYPTRRETTVLRGFNLLIEPGLTYALVGKSGCGKSTILALLERFYNTDGGKILIDNMDITRINVNHLRCHIGYVTQEPVLLNTSIRNNIAYGLIALGIPVTDDQIFEAAKIANIHNFIMSLPEGYETKAGERGARLSGGQKQRIAIARAIIRNPKILLLDEATSALDSENEKVVQEALDKAREGRTSIVIAHRLSTVQNADCIVVVHQGKVVEQGTHDVLMKKQGIYFDLVKNQ